MAYAIFPNWSWAMPSTKKEKRKRSRSSHLVAEVCCEEKEEIPETVKWIFPRLELLRSYTTWAKSVELKKVIAENSLFSAVKVLRMACVFPAPGRKEAKTTAVLPFLCHQFHLARLQVLQDKGVECVWQGLVHYVFDKNWMLWVLLKTHADRLAGPPITNETAVIALLDEGVTVGLGVSDAWQAPHTRFDAAWVSHSVFRSDT